MFFEDLLISCMEFSELISSINNEIKYCNWHKIFVIFQFIVRLKIRNTMGPHAAGHI